MRPKVFYAQRRSDGSFIRAPPPAAHRQRHSFPEEEESRVSDTNGRDLACEALSRIHAHGLIIPAPVAAVCISVFGAFHHRPFASESIPSPLSPAFPSSHLFVPLIYGGIEVRGRRINGEKSHFVIEGGSGDEGAGLCLAHMSH